MRTRRYLKNRDGRVVFYRDDHSDREFIEAAVSTLGTLSNVRLDGRDLTGIQLPGVSFDGSSVCGTNFTDANLAKTRWGSCTVVADESVIFTRANLAEADLAHVNTEHPFYSDRAIASCSRADFSGTVIRPSRLWTTMTPDQLRSVCGLDEYRMSVRRVLDRFSEYVSEFLRRLREGAVAGTVYLSGSGDSGCLIGTMVFLETGLNLLETGPISFLAKVREHGTTYTKAEQWFEPIRLHETPQSNPFSALVEQWILEWQEVQDART